MSPHFRPPFGADPETEEKTGGWGRRGGLFGRHRGGPFGRRAHGGRIFDSGALRLVVLGLIGEEPRHGYDIIKGLNQRFQGAYSPSPGAIYPMLRILAEAGLIASSSWGPKRRFEITEEGRAYLAEHAEELDKINAQIAEASTPIGDKSLGEAIRDFRATLFSRMRKGGLSAEQAEKIRDVLVKARDEIEKI